MNIWILSTAFVALILLMIRRHWFMSFLMPSASKPLPGASADPDLCCHMVSPDHNDISHFHIHNLLPKHFNLVGVYEFENKLEFVNP